MKFTLAMPVSEISPPGEFQNYDAICKITAALESSGVDAGYITDHPAPWSEWLHQGMGHDALDPFTELAFVAASCTKLMVHTNIVVIPYRNPFITAKAAASLQVLSGGRLILGCGAGYQKQEFDALGVDYHRRGKLFDEAIEVMRLAWQGKPVTYEGMDFSAVGNEPRPACEPAPPIWIGGSSPAALRRAAQHGDGWVPFFTSAKMTSGNQAIGIRTAADLKERIDRIQDMRAGYGRTGKFEICTGPQVEVGYDDMKNIQPYIDSLGELAEAGVGWISAHLPSPSLPGYIECVQWFGEEVIAKIRG